MRPGVSSGEREGYATAVTGLWRGLSHALTALEAIAADPEALTEEVLAELSALQYALHAAAEQVVGIDPPHGAESQHAELAAALAGARDATAEVSEAIELGGTLAAEPLVPEWRGGCRSPANQRRVRVSR